MGGLDYEERILRDSVVAAVGNISVSIKHFVFYWKIFDRRPQLICIYLFYLIVAHVMLSS